jgi:hypothetical protein
MKRFVQRTCLVYGCLTLVASTTWFLITWLFRPLLPDGPGPVIATLIIHGLVLTLTFQSFVGPKPFW